jgi:hypothetical protein
VEHLSGAPLGQAPALPAKIRLDRKGLPGTNTSLLRKSVNYGQKSSMTYGPWWLGLGVNEGVAILKYQNVMAF